jgi:conjugative relaxase-like TrwC/TraI family protein
LTDHQPLLFLRSKSKIINAAHVWHPRRTLRVGCTQRAVFGVVTVSIKRMSAGDGYRYLMRTVAAGGGVRDMSSPLTRYYTESGNPPGRWLGEGLIGLDGGRGLEAGSVASEEQMFRLFGMGNDPVTGEQLGNRPYHIDANGRGSVAGFDLTFSVPKSVSAWWAVADAGTQAAIVEAHHAAMHACIEFLEAEVAATRVGKNGVAQADVRGLIGAAFDHWDSRAGDPQLHRHVVIANRVQTADARWRTLDSRALYRSIVAVSETYNALLADELARRAARLGSRGDGGTLWFRRGRSPAYRTS